jgi:raffinose/stachyose/melibiose transport system substrate-binding protein
MNGKSNVGSIVLSLALLAALLLGACSTATPPTEEMPAQEEPAAEESQEEDTDVTEAEAPDEKVTLVMESWFTIETQIWDDVILPAFNAHYPNIEIVFSPTQSTEYNAALNAKLEGGTAGDLITCRGFDASLALFNQGYLSSLNDLPGMENFSDVATSAWITDDGSHVYCVPMGSVMQGFIYNADIFEELGLTEPETEEEFFELLDAIQADGTYVPLGLGTKSLWESATMGFENIGPNYWKGEEGRLAIIDGTQKFTDPQYVAVWESLAKWRPYLSDGFEAQTYNDSQNLFTLGRSVVYPAGSWEIALFNRQAEFEMGVFPPPLPEGSADCYISDHTDIALGMNEATEHPEEARIFLEWVTSAEFADLYSNNFPGFFTLSNHNVELSDPLANEFLSWRDICDSTIRISYQILSRNTEPNLENQLWNMSAQVINGDISPQVAAETVQSGLETWYEPQQ